MSGRRAGDRVRDVADASPVRAVRSLLAVSVGAIALFLSGCATTVGPGPFGEPMSGTAYVVRHMEKEAGDDPALTAAGHADAVRLADLLIGDPPIAIYATDTRRARQTAEPTAAWGGQSVRLYDPANPTALAARIAVRPGTVLLVGHSNTVPDLVERLGGARPGPIDEATYGVVYRIDRVTGRTSAITLRGAANGGTSPLRETAPVSSTF